MLEVKLSLQNQNNSELLAFAIAHQAAIKENANFPDPVPDLEVFDAELSEFKELLAKIAAAEIVLETLRAKREESRERLEAGLTSRGRYVQRVSCGDEAKILSAGFQAKGRPTAITSLPAPEHFTAGMGRAPGEIDLRCQAVKRARSYLIEYREVPDDAEPGPWCLAGVKTRCFRTLTGLVPGRLHGFRIRAYGPNQLESPWSHEVRCRVP